MGVEDGCWAREAGFRCWKYLSWCLRHLHVHGDWIAMSLQTPDVASVWGPMHAKRTSQSLSSSPPPNPVHWTSRYPVSVGLSCHPVFSIMTCFQSLYFGSAWLARISLMASSGLLESICSRFCSASSRGRIWSVGSCRLACCPQRTYVAWQVWGQGVWLLLWWGNSTGVHKLWSNRTCVRVSLRCSATWGFAASLLPRTKSLPVGWVHSGGNWSTPISATASGNKPCHCHCLSFFPMSTLFPWKACTTGGRQYAFSTSLLWKSLSPGRQRMGKSAGKTDIGESAPCSKMGRAQVRKGGVLWM